MSKEVSIEKCAEAVMQLQKYMMGHVPVWDFPMGKMEEYRICFVEPKPDDNIPTLQLRISRAAKWIDDMKGAEKQEAMRLLKRCRRNNDKLLSQMFASMENKS